MRARAGGKLRAVELLIAVNPDPDSRLPYLMRLPLGDGMVFRTSGTWPRTKALYCYPASVEEWPPTRRSSSGSGCARACAGAPPST